MHDSQVLPELLHGQETRVWGDAAYSGQQDVLHQHAPGATSFIHAKAVKAEDDCPQIPDVRCPLSTVDDVWSIAHELGIGRRLLWLWGRATAEEPRPLLLAEAIALAFDIQGGRVVQQAVQQSGGGEHVIMKTSPQSAKRLLLVTMQLRSYRRTRRRKKRLASSRVSGR